MDHPVASRRLRSFGERLEERARVITRFSRPGSLVAKSVLSELALALDQIQRLRFVHGRARRELATLDLYLSNELLRLQPPQPVYEDRYRNEREKLRARQLKLHVEKRSLILREDEQLRGLHDRLLTLMNRCEHFSRDNADE